MIQSGKMKLLKHNERVKKKKKYRDRERERGYIGHRSLEIVITPEINDQEIRTSKALSVWNVVVQPECVWRHRVWALPVSPLQLTTTN